MVEGDFTGGGFPARGGYLGADALFCKAIHHTLDGALRRRDEGCPASGVGVREELGHHGVDFFDIAARGGPWFEFERKGLLFRGGEHSRWGESPQRQAGLANGDLERLIGAIAGCLGIESFGSQRAIGTHGRGLPTGGEEFRIGLF